MNLGVCLLGHHQGDILFEVCVELAFLVSITPSYHLYPPHNTKSPARTSGGQAQRAIMLLDMHRRAVT